MGNGRTWRIKQSRRKRVVRGLKTKQGCRLIMSIALGARHRASSLPSLLDFLFSYFLLLFFSAPRARSSTRAGKRQGRDREETDTRRRNGKGKKNVEKNKWRDEADGSMSIFVLIADQRIKYGRRLKPHPYHGNLEIEGCLHSR